MHFHVDSVRSCALQGYQGLVDGGEHIRPATWESVSMMLQLVSDRRTESQNAMLPTSVTYFWNEDNKICMSVPMRKTSLCYAIHCSSHLHSTQYLSNNTEKEKEVLVWWKTFLRLLITSKF